MGFIDYTFKLLGLSETIHTWYDQLQDLDLKKRERLAAYCEKIADTLARIATSFDQLNTNPKNQNARKKTLREFGRIAGYVEDITDTLKDHLDGRKLAGVKRRLEQLVEVARMRDALEQTDDTRINRLYESEGYFRSLADHLRS